MPDPAPVREILSQRARRPAHADRAGSSAARRSARIRRLPNTVISLGRTVVVEGTVHGDVIVVDADLYMHPGGTIDGRAIAIGGGVYESMLAHTRRQSSPTATSPTTSRPSPAVTALTYRPLCRSPADTAGVSLPGILRASHSVLRSE